MQSDLNWLQSKILAYHPACDDSIRFDSVSTAFQLAQYEAEKPLTETEFLRLLSSTLISLRCGHTSALPSKAFYAYYRKAKPKPLFPLQVYARPEGMYVRYNGSNDSTIAVGDKVLTINQESTETLSRRILDFLPGDGYHQSFKQFHLSLNFPTYYLFLKGPSYSYEAGITDSLGQYREHHLSLRSSGKASTRPNYNRSIRMYRIRNQNLSNRIWSFFGFARKKEVDDFRILGQLEQNKNMAYLKIAEFGGPNSWYEKAFAIIAQKKYEYLVLDLRGNSGGDLNKSNLLLSYLLPDTFSFRAERIQQSIRLDGNSNMNLLMRMVILGNTWLPSEKRGSFSTCTKVNNRLITRHYFEPRQKNCYRNKLLILTDGGTFSAASWVAATLRKKLGTPIAGEETGGGANGCNAMVTPTLTLPRSRMRVTLPLYYINHEMPPGTPNRGLIPEIPLQADIEQKIKGLDTELEAIAQHPDWFEPQNNIHIQPKP